MKSAPFEYLRPRTVAEICALLAQDEDACIIAGGQTLVPMMAMRLARPSRLIDITRIAELRGFKSQNETVAIGATTRQAEAENNTLVAARLPLLAKALPWVGHAATRNRGTIGGSIANADPAAEIPLVLVTIGGEILARDVDGIHKIAASEFFVGPMMTSLKSGSCITEIRLPVWNQGRVGAGFQEISARRGDFALAAAAAQIAFDDSGRCTACAIGIGGATATPARLGDAEANLIGTHVSDADIGKAVAGATDRVEIMSSPHASDGYRRRAVGVLAIRALTEARDSAVGRARGAQP